MNHSTPGLPIHHKLPEFTQTHAHWVDDAIQSSHPLLSPSPPAPNPSKHQGLFQWVSSSYEVTKVLEFQLQHQFFQWTPRTYLLQDGLVGSPLNYAKLCFPWFYPRPFSWFHLFVDNPQIPISNPSFSPCLQVCFSSYLIDFVSVCSADTSDSKCLRWNSSFLK